MAKKKKNKVKKKKVSKKTKIKNKIKIKARLKKVKARIKKRVKPKVKNKVKKIIRDPQIEDMVLTIAGENGFALYNLLLGRKNVSEFVLVDKLNLTINQIRNILYKFDEYSLVSSTRKKDRKKGWYIYYWTFEIKKAKLAIVLIKKLKIRKLNMQLERESNFNFFTCPKKCIRLTYETAMENHFQCLECGNLLIPDDNTKLIKKIKKDIESLEKEISEQETK